MSKEKTTKIWQPVESSKPDGTTVSIHSQQPDTSVKPVAQSSAKPSPKSAKD